MLDLGGDCLVMSVEEFAPTPVARFFRRHVESTMSVNKTVESTRSTSIVVFGRVSVMNSSTMSNASASASAMRLKCQSPGSSTRRAPGISFGEPDRKLPGVYGIVSAVQHKRRHRDHR